MNVPQCCKENPYACIDVKINNSFSNKIMLCTKHCALYMESYDEFVSILGYILQQEPTEAIETTKKQSDNKHRSMPPSTLGKLPEDLLSIQNIEELMTVSLEKNTSNKLVITSLHTLEDMIGDFLVLNSNKKLNLRSSKPIIHVCGTKQFDFANLESIITLKGVPFD